MADPRRSGRHDFQRRLAALLGASPEPLAFAPEAPPEPGLRAFDLAAGACFDRPGLAGRLLRLAGARPRSLAPALLRAWALYILDRPAEAERAYFGALALAPGRLDLWIGLGMCLRRRGSPLGEAVLFNLPAFRREALRRPGGARLGRSFLARAAAARTPGGFARSWKRLVPPEARLGAR